MSGLFAGTPLERPVTCEACGRTLAECSCPRDAAGRVLLPSNQPARVRREKRSGGKTVTIVTGLDPVASNLIEMLRELKTKCATGGSAAHEHIKLQGDHRETVIEYLKAKGYPAKAAGG